MKLSPDGLWRMIVEACIFLGLVLLISIAVMLVIFLPVFLYAWHQNTHWLWIYALYVIGLLVFKCTVPEPPDHYKRRRR